VRWLGGSFAKLGFSVGLCGFANVPPKALAYPVIPFIKVSTKSIIRFKILSPNFLRSSKLGFVAFNEFQHFVSQWFSFCKEIILNSFSVLSADRFSSFTNL
jgi:hypothetical protein